MVVPPVLSCGFELIPAEEQELDGADAHRAMKASFFGEVCWIVSEVFWILLVPFICVPAVLFAFFSFLFVAILLSCSKGPLADDAVPVLMQVCWLGVNVVWEIADMVVDSPEQPTPWNLTPIFHDDDILYDTISFSCAVGFCCLPMVWCFLVLLYCCSILSVKWTRAMVFQAGYISCWSLMDGLWALELLWPALAACAATVGLILIAAAEETGLGLCGVDRTDVVWILWSLSNACWMWCELAESDDFTWRLVAAGAGVASLLVLLNSYGQTELRSSVAVPADEDKGHSLM